MLKQAIIVNKELGMTKGKIAAQVGHGTVYYVMRAFSKDMSGIRKNDAHMLEGFIMWEKEGMTKIVLKATQDEIERLYVQLGVKEQIWCRKVHDFGRTQVAPNSLTCLIVEPLREELANEFFSHLKLL